MKKLIIKNLKQQYTYGAIGVQDLSLELGENETVAILGGKESGKTSLIKCIAGLAPQSGGEIFINEENANQKKPKERDVLLVYEDGGFFEYKDVFYNLSYPLKIRKVDKDTIRKKVIEAASRLGLEYLLDYKIKYLSSSERVKVMIARALMRQASVYLFDDPFKNVQPFFRQKLFSEIYPHIKDIKGAKIFATSSADEAKTVSDKIVIMNYGFVVDEGDTKTISESPSSVLSYKYMYGDLSNVIKTTICKDENNLYIDMIGQRVELESKKLINSIYIKKEVIACFVAKESSKGSVIEKRFIEYQNNLKILNGIVNGKRIRIYIDKQKEKYFAEVDKNTLRLFDVNSERSIYF